jgi:GNAT superfamily N-acetyltransferase
MILDYIKDRYNEDDFAPLTLEQVAEQLQFKYKEADIKTVKMGFGFFTYKSQGDALVIYDLFTTADKRSKKYAWKLFERIQEVARELNKSVLIGFSDVTGKNHEMGRGAMRAAGFVPSHTLTNKQVYIRGI